MYDKKVLLKSATLSI